MYEQVIEVASSEALTAAGGTETFTLETAGTLSYIDLLVDVLTATADGTAAKKRILDYLTAIEIIGDGTDVITSLNGRQLAACNFYDLRTPVDELVRIKDATHNYLHIPIMFGRYPGDPNYALDLSKWDKVQLKITNAALTGDAFGTVVTATHNVNETFLKPDVSPAGYLKRYELDEWTLPASSGDTQVDIPTKYPIRKVLTISDPTSANALVDATHTVETQITNLKFSLGSGGTILFDDTWIKLMRMNAQKYGTVRTRINGVLADADVLDSYLGYVLGGNCSPAAYVAAGAGQVAMIGFPWSSITTATVGAATLAGENAFTFEGIGYALSTVFDFDPNRTMDNLLDPEAEKTVRLKYTGTDDPAGNIHTVIEQVVT